MLMTDIFIDHGYSFGHVQALIRGKSFQQCLTESYLSGFSVGGIIIYLVCIMTTVNVNLMN